MTKEHSELPYKAWIAICAAALVIPCSPVHAARAIHELRNADPQGQIEIENLAGSVEVDAWSRSEVEVSGTVGDNVERVDVDGAGNRTSIRVLPRTGHNWNSDSKADLVIHVPAKSMVNATLVSADLKVSGVQGDLKLQTVSGNVRGDAGGDVRAATVSGDVHLAAPAAKVIEIRTISGDIKLTGGGGDVDLTTVSGTAIVELADVSRARLKSVSGDMSATLTLQPEGQLEGESVSGSVELTFAKEPAAEFDVQSFSGDIKNCFGPKPVEPRYGPGSRLEFKNGEGHARVLINTKSGDVRLCAKGLTGTRVSALSPARVADAQVVLPYVY
jgi:Putative adhesin